MCAPQNTKCGALYPNIIRMALDLAPSAMSGILAIGAWRLDVCVTVVCVSLYVMWG